MTAISVGQAPSAPANRAASGPIPTYGTSDDAQPRTQFRSALRAATKTDAPKPGDDQALAQAQAQAGAQALAQALIPAVPIATPLATGDPAASAAVAGIPATAATAIAQPVATLTDLPGDATQGIATPGAPAPQAGVAPPEDSPVAAWLAAAVGRAISSFSQGAPKAGAATGSAAGVDAKATAGVDAKATAAVGANPTAAVDAKTTAVTKAAFATLGSDAPSALTPLEQAVHELISQLGERKPGRAVDDKPETASDDATAIDPSALSFARPDAPIATAPNAAPHRADAAAPVRELPQPELPPNPSHVHMVLDDGPERVVMTVAVRGSEVHVALRGGDDATTNALARNAASLDDAMRARGLSLGDFKADREPGDQRQRQPEREQRERAAPNADAEPFKLEEIR